MKDVERIAMLCHEANRLIADVASATRELPTGRGAILSRTNEASNALAAILRECDRIETWTPPDLDRCPECGKERPKVEAPGPPPVPGQWFCLAHRHLKPRTEWA